MKLQAKNAIVTGASRGLGAACAKLLVKKSTTVYGLARSLDALKTLQNQLGDLFIPVQLDITQKGKVEQWVGSTFSDDHLPDILINNAGAGIFGKVDELPDKQWHQMVDTNVTAVFNVTSLVIPFMKRNEQVCHIVNTGSILGKIGSAERSGYCATKFAIQGFSESLFKELRYDGIKMTCLNPGSIETDFFKESGVKSHANMLQPGAIAATLVHILETPDNFLINDITMRPLNPKPQ